VHLLRRLVGERLMGTAFIVETDVGGDAFLSLDERRTAMKAFLFVFDSTQITRKLVTKRLDNMPNIANWYAFLENTVCLASKDDPSRSRL
jgi:hypothetical protein